MGRLPSHIFVVRHGNRLDAADKQWHLTSPTPYDPPLTYGGFLQARLVGNQIGGILERAKTDAEVTNNGASLSGKHRRFKVVIHSSPFLRCVQTSIAISSGLAQTAPESIYKPSDVIIPRKGLAGSQDSFKPSLLRLDPFLGEWLTPEYFELITPPPGPALMMGSAKAELLRRGDYSQYQEGPVLTNHRPAQNGALWSSPRSSLSLLTSPSPEKEGTPGASAETLPTASQHKRGYVPLRPMYAVSSSGKIPDGFVTHARDSCTVVDYQWDSMREALDFGDGGKLGEEWTSMHQRFRSGLKKLVNWYATTNSPDELPCALPDLENCNGVDGHDGEEDVETIVILVSHGAGCNALIGAITHQPVLLDVGIASITMATRKPNVDYETLLEETRAQDPDLTQVPVDELYQIRLSASTEHLRTNSGTPIFTRSGSPGNTFNSSTRRGRTSTLAGDYPTIGGPVLSPFTYREALSVTGSRSTSAGASEGYTGRRDSGFSFPGTKVFGMRTASAGQGDLVRKTPSPGLWAPAAPALRLLDEEHNEEAVDDFDTMLPDFDNKRFATDATKEPEIDVATSASEQFPDLAPAVQLPQFLNMGPASTPPKGPVLAAPIKVNRDLIFGDDISPPQADGGFDGLWSLSVGPQEAEHLRDLSHSKRRWTVNERA